MSKKKTKETLTYGEATAELEGILEEIEAGEADVDVLSEKVERAAALIRMCQDKISGAELKVREVLDGLEQLDEDQTAGGEAEEAGAEAEA